jgi:phage tail-like protein
MSTAEYLPAIPAPPHDPTSLLLNAEVGWQKSALQHLILTSRSGALMLAPAQEVMRSLLESSGSFGGLALPTGLTFSSSSDLFLLDRQRLELKRFDPCECVFVVQSCFGGQGGGPRQLRDPHGIGIHAGLLYVCDTGNQRVALFTLHGFALLGHWLTPGSAGLKSWQPYDVEFDYRGRVYISDRANGVVHLFSRIGRWLGMWAGLPGASHLAHDRKDRVYVVVEAATPEVRQLKENWQSEVMQDFPSKLTTDFTSLPFSVDREGELNLESLCLYACTDPSKMPSGQAENCLFDLNGEPVKPTSGRLAVPIFEKEGHYVSKELDSQLYRCQWHRVILRGEIPAGTRVLVSTFTAEVILEASEMPDNAWQTYQPATQIGVGGWDCLIRSGGGRYLWLRLVLTGNGMLSPRLESLEIEFPRISLRRYLPAIFAEEPVSADFTDRYLSLFDTTLRTIEGRLDKLAEYFDPLSAPADPLKKGGIDFLAWLGTWIGVSMDRHWPEAKRRRFLKESGHLFDLRGTRYGLWRQLVIYLDMQVGEDCYKDFQPRTTCQPRPANCAPQEEPRCDWQPPPLILEHYQLRRWLFLGAGRLGDQAELWGKRIVNRSQLGNGAQVSETQLLTTQDPYRDPFHVYAHKFTVFAPGRYRHSDRHRKGLENLLKSESPGHTQFQLEYVEPRFRVGIQAMIGYDAVIGKYPQGVSLDETPLGQGSILTSKRGTDAGRTLEIEKASRIGTARLLGTLDQGSPSADCPEDGSDDPPACGSAGTGGLHEASRT